MLLSTVVIARVGSEADAALAKAQRLGQYTLEERIGVGGMGEVYRARHAMLRRPTAIKLLPSSKSSERDLARFEQEVQITSRLTHPNTIAIYDYGRTPEGVFYYVMEYLPGLGVDGIVDATGPLPADRTIHLLVQICGSLAEAHGAGLIHRDIKPANVIVCERGGIQDVAKVLDFGIARDLQGEHTGATQGGIAGTPLFMSPEALRANERVDGRSDIYSIGAMAYYMISGTPVFEGGSPAEVGARHLRDDPEPPSTRVSTPVAADLERIILACLQKDPDRRPQTVESLAASLAACADAGSWGQDDASAWWAEHAELVSERQSVAASGRQLAIQLATRPS
jgi:serine/threonine protein kinase